MSKKKLFKAQKRCVKNTCNEWGVYSKKRGGKWVHYCARHWQSDVEADPKWQKNLRAHQKQENRRRLTAATKPKRKVVRSGQGGSTAKGDKGARRESSPKTPRRIRVHRNS